MEGLGDASLWPEPDTDLIPESMYLEGLAERHRGKKAPTDWREWLTSLFPRHFDRPLGRRHLEFWRWVIAVRAGERPRPLVGIWPRGSGKSTSAEAGAVALGVRGHRKYGIYVCGTQDQADKHVETIASLLESAGVERHYPDHAKPKIGKFGNQRAWRRNRVWTAGGFAIDALGLDVAARGIKLDEQRPDFAVLDDIDGMHDSVAATAKKLETITQTILPTLSEDGAVLAIQNVVLRGGIFTQLADGTADFLADRILSGPFPAIEGLEWEYRRHPESGIKHAVITKGKATWEGQPIEACQNRINTFGIHAFIKECQHDVKKGGMGLVLRMKPSNMIDLSDDECRQLLALNTGFGGLDFQLARFAFVLFAVDKHRRVIRIDEYFSQFEGLRARARAIHEMCEFYGVTGMMPIWGDCANPQDIAEMNEHFRDGWDIYPCTKCGAPVPDENTRCQVDGCGGLRGKPEHVSSKLRVLPVGNENKLRRPAVEKVNDALDRDILLYRTGIEYDWLLARTSTNDGTPMYGSRLLWESENWAFPKMKPGQAQDENPDDHTADGADCMAAQRYALISHWRKAKLPLDFGRYEDDRGHAFDYKQRNFVEPKHAIDLIQNPGGRWAPRVAMPRPRGIPGLRDLANRVLDDDYIDLG